jgi:hypothetical protein
MLIINNFNQTDLSRKQAIQNQRNSFLRGFLLSFNVETPQAFGALFQIPHYYRKFLYCYFLSNSRLHTEVGSVSFLSRAKIVYQGVAQVN